MFKVEHIDEIDEKLNGTDLDLIHGEEDYNIYIGRYWSSVKDDETGKQFKDSIKAKITELTGEESNCSTYEEAWRNG